VIRTPLIRRITGRGWTAVTRPSALPDAVRQVTVVPMSMLLSMSHSEMCVAKTVSDPTHGPFGAGHRG
jgi:hypothetical protein